MMKTNSKRRFAVIISAIMVATNVVPTMASASKANDLAAETSTVAQSDVTATNKELPHSFRIGSKGYSFTAFTNPVDENSEPQEAKDAKHADYIILKEADSNYKDFDLDDVYRCEIGQKFEWTFKNMTFRTQDINVNDVTEDFSKNILQSIVNLKTPTEDEVWTYDMNKDGKINVVDVVCANQIRSAYPLNYLGGELSIQQFMWNVIPLVKTCDYVKVYIDEGEVFCDCYGETKPVKAKNPDEFYMSDGDYTHLAYGAYYYGIENYRIVYSEEPIMYAYGFEAEVDSGAIYQILPASYQKRLMSEYEYSLREEATADNIAFIYFGQWYGAVGCLYDHRLSHYEVKNGEDIGLANWYLIPVDEQGNDIKQIAAGSQFLRDWIASDGLYNPPVFDENGNEIMENTAKANLNLMQNVSSIIGKIFKNATNVFNVFK